MPDPLILILSVFCVSAGVMVILFPDVLVKMNLMLSRPVMSLDPFLLRHRHLLGLLLFLVGYGTFWLALWLLPYRA
jgi:hypothetical protein